MATQDVSIQRSVCRRVEPRMHELSPNDARLVELMESIQYGSIRKLRIRNGEADLDSKYKVSWTVKIRGCDPTESKAVPTDFAVRSDVVKLLIRLRQIGNGTIKKLTVQAGLPVRFEMCKTVRTVRSPR